MQYPDGMTASFVSDVTSISTVRRRHLQSLERIRVLRSRSHEELRRARLSALLALRQRRPFVRAR
jgi:hypothetical protein